MMKKLISLLGCLLPFGAGAVNVYPISGNVVSTSQDAWTDAIQENLPIVISTVTPGGDSPVVGLLAENGFAIENIYAGIQTPGGAPRNLYVLNVSNGPFSIVAKNDVSINSMLQVLNGFALDIMSEDAENAVPFNLTIGNDVTGDGIIVGATTDRTARLNIEDILNLSIKGNVYAYGNMQVKAENISAKSMNVSGSVFYMDASNSATFGNVVYNGGVATDFANISAGAGGISVTNIQNNGAGVLALASNGGTINITNNLENNGSQLNVNDGNLVVGGAIVNTSNGTLNLVGIDSLNVTGNFINSGNLYANIAGQAVLGNGLDTSGAANNRVVQITTGGLDLGTANALVNNLNNMDIVIKTDDFSVGSITNGTSGNANANLSVDVTNNMVVDTLVNQVGTLDIDAGALTVNNTVTAGAQTTTTIDADNAIVMNAGVNNAGNMSLNATDVTMAGAVNTGSLDVITSVDTGNVVLSGVMTNNAGDTSIRGKVVDASAAQIVNNGGETTITAGMLTLGGLNVSDGVANVYADGVVSTGTDIVVGKLQNGEYVRSGELNFGPNVYGLSAVGAIRVAGDLNVANASAAGLGNVNISNVGVTPFIVSSESLNVGGDINVASESDVAYQIQVKSDTISIGGDVDVNGQNAYVLLGDDNTDDLTVAGNFGAENSAVLETYSDDVTVGSMIGDGKYLVHGNAITVTDGDLNLAANVYMDGTNADSGLVIKDSNDFTITNVAENGDVSVADVSISGGKKLTINSKHNIVTSDVVNRGTLDMDAGNRIAFGAVENYSDLNVVADAILGGSVTNTGNFYVDTTGTVLLDSVDNSASFVVADLDDLNQVLGAAESISVAGNIANTAGNMELNAGAIFADSLIVSGGNVEVSADSLALRNKIDVEGDLTQGGSSGVLDIYSGKVSADSILVSGNFIAGAGSSVYDINSSVVIGQNLENVGGITFDVDGNMAVSGDVTNEGNLTVSANGVKFNSFVNNSGVSDINSGAGIFELGALKMNSGNLILRGSSMNVDTAIDTNSILYQNYKGDLFVNDINIMSNDYTITTPNFTVGGISQRGRLVVNSSDIMVNGFVDANDLRFIANDARNWMNVKVTGDLAGAVDFIGLEKMSVGGNYTFGAGSVINAAILPYAIGGTIDSTDINYWAQVSLPEGNAPVQIVKPDNAIPMINVGGVFTAGTAYTGDEINGAALANGQIGISLFDAVDTGTAIWFLHANGGVQDMGQIEKLRNLDVQFCNADGSLCYNYLESLTAHNESEEDLPAYISVRDDDLYIVFDPRFGGPVLLQDNTVQQIVARDENHTKGELTAAGALDNMVFGRAHDMKFYNKTPIEVIPLIFDGTNMETLANELYNRLENYNIDRNPTSLANFSRLNQVREVEQLAGAIVLNEHTAFRSFEDRMFDEFIWNRNRQLKKAWLDVDYGMFTQNVLAGDHADGNRLSISGGFDWQESNTLLLGLTGRVTHTSSKVRDSMDLSYADIVEMGQVSVDTTDTNIGLGGYLMKTLGDKARVYGNAFLDIHVLDVNRSQNFVETIDGDGVAFSLISEWGLMHDILNQYIVGNVYARLGYNSGFSVTEKVSGEDYMKMESDGYFVLTPGYSLIAQKRIYPSAWFQIRPYASVGIEYDLLGAPDSLDYKYISADRFTKYDIDIDPMWANIGGGIEFLSAHGVQFGVDYRYQYNSAIQLHNIKVSGSYRF